MNVSSLGKAVHRVASVQGATSALVALGCAVLVLYPIVFLVTQSLNTGDPVAFPPLEYGLANYRDIALDWNVISNTAYVACLATAIAVAIGFVLAWILTRTKIPGRAVLERALELPYYLTPLVGALAWSILAAPKSGFINQVIAQVGGPADLFDVYTPFGIAWVMALFEGTVAFVMISAVMKSMDPALEESSRVLGAGKFRTIAKVTLPLVLPGVLGATVFVFAEMLGSFAAALVLGIPGRYYVVTTAIWQSTLAYPPEYGRAAAMGVCLLAVLLLTLWIYRRIIRGGHFATISGKGFRPRTLDMGGATKWLVAGCWAYVALAVVLPLGALLVTSFQRFATVRLEQAVFTLANYSTAVHLDVVQSAIGNSLILGLGVATVGVFIMATLVWIIYRTRLPGRGLLEYVVMLPQSVPRMIFGLALLMAWLYIPIPLYGTLWVLAIAYFTVLLPLGFRTLGGVILQADKSLDECARVCGASWIFRMRTVVLPLLRPGIVAAWLLLFIASVRELGVSIYLAGPHTKVIAPAIVSSWSSSGSELTAAIALIQTATVAAALVLMLLLTRNVARYHQ